MEKTPEQKLKEMFPGGVPWCVFDLLKTMTPKDAEESMLPGGDIWFEHVLFVVGEDLRSVLRGLHAQGIGARSFVNLCETLVSRSNPVAFGFIVRSPQGDLYVPDVITLEKIPKHLREASEIVPIFRNKP